MKKKQYENPFLQRRMKRLDMIKQLVMKLSPIEYLKLIGLIETQFGLTNKKAMEHVGAIKRAGYIETYQSTKTNRRMVRVVK